MADDQFQDDSSSGNEDRGAADSESASDPKAVTGSNGVPDESELDDLLAQACSLADTISEETGSDTEESETPSREDSAPEDEPSTVADPIEQYEPGNELGNEPGNKPDSEPGQVPGNETGIETGSEPGNIDAQLADLDDLVAQTEGLLGGGDDQPNGDDPEAESAPQAPVILADPHDVPATLDTDTASLTPIEEPLEEVESAPATPNPAIAVDPAIGIVSSRTKGEAVEGEADPPGAGSTGMSFGRVLRLLEPLVMPACDLGVTLLERLDKPFGRLGSRVRQIIGWLAIATFTTSILTLLISLF